MPIAARWSAIVRETSSSSLHGCTGRPRPAWHEMQAQVLAGQEPRSPLKLDWSMSEQPALALVMTTVETAEDADDLARSLVDQSLAACVQVDGPITSHYRWQGKRERATEIRLLIKTSQTAWPRLKERLIQLHPYDEPEIIMLPIADVSDGYRRWVLDQTS